MNKNNFQKARGLFHPIGIFLFFWLAVSLMPVYARAPEYDRNGECYLLIGDGAKRGVYRLNNPSNESGISVSGSTSLYDPLSSYGISVNLNRHIFTFSETLEHDYTILPGNIKVKAKPAGQAIMQGFHADHRNYWGEKYRPVYTTSGAPSCYVQLTAKTYGYDTVAGSYGVEKFPIYVVTPDAGGYISIPNGEWYQSFDPDRMSRPGKHYRDRVIGKAHNYDLLEWYSGISGNIPTDKGKKAESFDKKIARAMLGSCIDPCGTDQLDLTQDADPQYVSISLSSLGRTYCYTRTQSSTEDGKVTLDNSAYTGPLIRQSRLNDPSTQWVGCSLRSTTSDYVYVLGSQVIKDWLIAKGVTIPPGFNITAVSVSDQWYLNGGIVFAYNASNGMAYQFTRTENTDGSEGSSPYYRGVNLGTGIDDVKADGDGNLYYGKTAKFPNAPSGFTTANISNLEWTSVSKDINRATGRIVFNQRITKSVYRLGLSAVSGTLEGSAELGNDKWEQYFWVPYTLSDGTPYNTITKNNYPTYAATTDWHWIDLLPKKDPTPSVALPTRVQLGVINVAAPPRVYKIDGKAGVIDIVGPLNGTDWITNEVRQNLYTFKAENNPLWERDDWNKRYYDPSNPANIIDINGNGTLGGFVSTVSKKGTYVSSELSDHVLYEWSIYQIQDAYGVATTTPQLVKCSGTNPSSPEFTPKPEISHYLTSGLYQITCRAKFKWYDYDRLPFGSTIADKPACLIPVGTAYEAADPAPTPAAVNTTTFPGLRPVPSDATTMLLKVNFQEQPPADIISTEILKKSPTDADFIKPKEAGGYKYHVVDERQFNDWKLEKEDKLFVLPTITDSNMVGTVRWADPVAYYTWSLQLDLPGNHPYPATLPGKNTSSSADTAVNFDIKIPTDPASGTLECNANRSYEYDYNAYDGDGNPLGVFTKRTTIKYRGRVNVLVLDKTPPHVVSVNGTALDGTTFVLKGFTGDSLSEAGLANPKSLKIVVRDNNPFANATYTCRFSERIHDPNNQLSTLFYERGSAKSFVPTTSLTNLVETTKMTVAALRAQVALGNDCGSVPALDARRVLSYSSPGLDVLNDSQTDTYFGISRARVTVPAGSLYSELEYEISLASFTDFLDQSQTTPSDLIEHPSRLPIDFANSSPNYDAAGSYGFAHAGYAITFTAQDSSGLRMAGPVLVSLIDIVDNKRPVLWVRVHDMKSEKGENIPELLGESRNYNHFPDIAEWRPNSAGIFSDLKPTVGGVTYWGLPVPPLASTTGILEKHPPEIENQVEILVTLNSDDNIGVAIDKAAAIEQERPAEEPWFEITGPNSSSLYYKEGSTAIKIPNPHNVQSYRTILRQPGVYEVSARVEDTARWFDNSTRHNTRTLKFGLIVVPTTMDIRIIERDSNRK